MKIFVKSFFCIFENNLQLGEKIRQFRKGKKLSQRNFGEAMGYSHIQISNIERGVIEPSRKLIKKLTEIYGITWEFLYGDIEPKEKKVILQIEVTEKDKQMIERTEGPQWVEKFVPIPVSKFISSGGPPDSVREDPDEVTIVYKDWIEDKDNITAVRIRDKSMEKTIPEGSFVGIDHSLKDIKKLNNKMVAFLKEGKAIIKRLQISSETMIYGIPDNMECFRDILRFEGEEIEQAIIGKVVWWWGRQE